MKKFAEQDKRCLSACEAMIICRSVAFCSM